MRNAIGIDIGGTKLRAARVSGAGEILHRCVMPTPREPYAALSAIDTIIAALKPDATEPIGIGVPGRIEQKTGRILSGGYVNLSGPALQGRLQYGKLHFITTDNDATMALIGEARAGAARNYQNVVLLTIGTGIGGAILDHGQVLHGRATAGQLGHLTVQHDGLPCLCGRRGCVETTSSGTALRRLIAEAGFPQTTGIDDLLADGSGPAKAVLDAWARPLRDAIDSLSAVLDPDLFVLGGGLGQAAARVLELYPPTSPWYQSPVVAAQLGDDAGIIGAGLAALERLP